MPGEAAVVDDVDSTDLASADSFGSHAASEAVNDARRKYCAFLIFIFCLSVSRYASKYPLHEIMIRATGFWDFFGTHPAP